MIVHVHICAPRGERFVRSGTCPDCKQWTRFLGISYEWYGSNQTCLKCGREWNDGEWMPLPFMRGARQQSIASAKLHWMQYAHSPNKSAESNGEPT